MLIISLKRNTIYLFLFLFMLFILFFTFFERIVAVRDASVNEHGYMILIEIEEKTLYLFDNKEIVKKYPVASGKPGYPSPIGSWKVVNKGDWGEGFGGGWLGLNVPWGNYGIHGTTREGTIGRSASHGCIRMRKKHIKELYDIVPLGTPVIIKNGPFGPFGTGFRELTPGDRGSDVLAVQRRLKNLGYFSGDETGIYEDDLKKAIYKFQEDKGLTIKYTITDADYNAMGFKIFE